LTVTVRESRRSGDVVDGGREQVRSLATVLSKAQILEADVGTAARDGSNGDDTSSTHAQQDQHHLEECVDPGEEVGAHAVPVAVALAVVHAVAASGPSGRIVVAVGVVHRVRCAVVRFRGRRPVLEYDHRDEDAEERHGADAVSPAPLRVLSPGIGSRSLAVGRGGLSTFESEGEGEGEGEGESEAEGSGWSACPGVARGSPQRGTSDSPRLAAEAMTRLVAGKSDENTTVPLRCPDALNFGSW
jgi:hypothetical protein